MQVSLVPTEYIELVWPNISNYIEGAAKYTYGRYTAFDIKYDLYNNEKQQLWIAFKDRNYYGAVVTEVCEYPQMRALVMHFTGGKNLLEWKTPMLKVLKQFAKENGCNVIESYGRPGWGKIFKKDGYEQKFIFYELPVE
jgi:hypothetical protein